MAFEQWKKVATRVLIAYKKWNYIEEDIQLPDGRVVTWQYIEGRGSATIVPIDGDGRLVLVRQYRYFADEVSLEFPAGGIEVGHTPEETAHKELAEETQLAAKKMTALGTCFPTMVTSNGRIFTFLAEDLTPTAGTPDDTEEFEHVRMFPEEFDELVKKGEIIAGHALCAWAVARDRVMEIFMPLRK